MSVRAASLACALFTLGAVTAAAQDAHDLRQLVGRKPAVGERVRVVKEERRTQRMGPRTQETGSAATYMEEVLATGEDGEPTRVVRTYEAFKDASGAEVAAAGVIVELTRDEATGRHAFAAAEGSAPLPPALHDDIQGSLDKKNKRAEQGVTDADINQVLLPADPVAVGGSWTIDLARAVGMMGLPESDVDLARSTAQGKVEGVEQVDGHDRLKFTIELCLMMAKMRGNPLPTPAPLVTTMTFRLPVAADGPDGDTHMVQHLALEVPGPQGPMKVTIDGDEKERRTRVE